MQINEQSIIGEIVAKDYRSASVFKDNGIDFCCNGNRSIADACNAKSINTQNLINDLQQVMVDESVGAIDFNAWSLDLLADYIEKKHHRYVKNKSQEILPYLQKIVKVHGDRHPELLAIEQLFIASVHELNEHMQKEEQVLFPHIRNMVEAQQEGRKIAIPFGTVQNPIAMMMQEHDVEGRRFEKISALTNDYTAPSDACNTYRITFALLKEFEQDLHLHIHLENNILFPKSIEAEKLS